MTISPSIEREGNQWRGIVIIIDNGIKYIPCQNLHTSKVLAMLDAKKMKKEMEKRNCRTCGKGEP